MTQNATANLPAEGYVRLPQILTVFPISRSAWWAGVRDGRYPAAVKLSPRCTAWPVESIRDLLARTQREATTA
jgi:predicted DNA-binding transcriptional regulator AlpA